MSGRPAGATAAPDEVPTIANTGQKTSSGSESE